MRARPTWVRKAILVGLALLVLIVGVLAYGGMQILADGPARPNRPPAADADEAERKLDLFEKARAARRAGYIRLTESEVNALIHRRYFDGEEPAGAPADSMRVLDAWVELAPGRVTWNCRLEKDWMGKRNELVWHRVFELNRKGQQWAFELKEARVGRLEIPEAMRGWIARQFAEADACFEKGRRWFESVPTLEVRMNELRQLPEIRLYNYLAPAEVKGGS